MKPYDYFKKNGVGIQVGEPEVLRHAREVHRRGRESRRSSRRLIFAQLFHPDTRLRSGRRTIPARVAQVIEGF